MAHGTWDDFTDKYGFSEGEMVEERDYLVRTELVRMLNELPAMKAQGFRAVEFDRNGCHNDCIIEIVGPDGTPTDLPDLGEDFYISDLISEAYYLVDSSDNE